MGKSAPKPPDPAEVAGAQTANNIGTAIANAHLGNVNQITPTGSLTYEQGEMMEWTDPNTGEIFQIPSYTATQALSDSEQAIFDASQQSRLNLAELGTTVSGQMQDHFATPFSLDEVPEGGSAANIRQPEYQSLGELERLSDTFDGGGEITTGVNSRADELRRDFGDVSIGASIADAGEILREFGDAGEITRTYGTDFSEDRRRVEDALFSRLNPFLDRDREALRTNLINQGIREGSEAFDRAMNRADEQSTDARMQVILAGGQEQSRLADLEARRAGFENAAQAQQFGQLFNRAQFTNNAQQQQFGQNRDSAALSLQGQIAQANAELARMQAENEATQMAFGMDLNSSIFANDAQAQQFAQNLATANFGNMATLSNNNMALTEANFANDIAQRNFENDAYIQDRMDVDRQQGIQEELLLRNQPINEIGALLGTGQVSMPNFVNTSMPQIPTVDRAGLEQAAYSQELANWQTQQEIMGQILGIGGNIAGAGIQAGYF